MSTLNKQLQERIGGLIGKDYFKLEWGCKIRNIHRDSIHYCVGILYDKVGYYNQELAEIRILDNDCVEIIGTEPTPIEYLLAISLHTGEEYCIDSKGKIFYIPSNGSELEYLDIDVFLTTGLFFLSDEVKQKLLDLIK